MKTKPVFWLTSALPLLGVWFLSASAVWGIGLRIPNQDAEAIARGNAFAATADNPSALYYNPAGITQLPGFQVEAGVLNYLGINTHHQPPNGAGANSKFQVLPIPQVYCTYSPTNLPLSFGLGLYAPFGLGVEWPQSSALRSLAINSSLQYLTLNPVLAWKINPHLSVALGPTFNYGYLHLTRGLATPTDLLDFKGTDLAYGFNGGVLWQPLDQWSFGANYRSAATMDFQGRTTYNSGASLASAATTARAHFPQIVSGGVSWRPTPGWNVEADVDWSDWSTLQTVSLAGTKALFGIDLPLELHWQNSWLFELGVTRYFAHGWFASAGYFYCTETASEKYFTPAIPDTVLHVASVGFGHQGERWRWALAAQYIGGPARSISDSQPNPFTHQSANGKYQLSIPTVSFSVGCRF